MQLSDWISSFCSVVSPAPTGSVTASTTGDFSGFEGNTSAWFSDTTAL